MLLKLMNEWRLMDELAVLRAIYLLGSGGCLNHFLYSSISSNIILFYLGEESSWFLCLLY